MKIFIKTISITVIIYRNYFVHEWFYKFVFLTIVKISIIVNNNYTKHLLKEEIIPLKNSFQ